MEMEIWKDVIGYEGKYKVSNYGRVFSIYSNKYLAQTKVNRGYLRVQLWKNNCGKAEYVHRLVARHFLDNPDNLPQVNHKDENKENNYVENLEWCSNEYNNAYGDKRKRQGETLKQNGKNSHKVAQYTLDDEYIATYRSMAEAERLNNMAHGSIGAMYRKGYSQAGGYHWRKIY